MNFKLHAFFLNKMIIDVCFLCHYFTFLEIIILSYQTSSTIFKRHNVSEMEVVSSVKNSKIYLLQVAVIFLLLENFSNVKLQFCVVYRFSQNERYIKSLSFEA